MAMKTLIFACSLGAAAIDCGKYPLVAVVTGPKANVCSGAGCITHWYAVGDENDATCWGSSSADRNSGNVHINSVSHVHCDGNDLAFIQFPNSTTCNSTLVPSGTQKRYNATCEVDIPPMLMSMVVNASCCVDPTRSCLKGVPHAEGKTNLNLFKNGQTCDQPRELPIPSGLYCGGVSSMLNIEVTFSGGSTVHLYHDLEAREEVIDCLTESIAISESEVTFPNSGNDGDCLGDALRTADVPRDPSKYKFVINTDGTLTFVTDHSQHILTACNQIVV